MVGKILEEIKTTLVGIDIHEASYEQNGYHLSVEALKGNSPEIAKFFKSRSFYLEDMFCVDYVDYLEIVYFFNRYSELCRVKVTLKIEPDKSIAPTISHIYTMARWYEREIHEF
jgi:NADH:ubiquinone oxidoreductase subunit C